MLHFRHVLNVAKEIGSNELFEDPQLKLKGSHIPLVDDESQDILSSFNHCFAIIGSSSLSISDLPKAAAVVLMNSCR